MPAWILILGASITTIDAADTFDGCQDLAARYAHLNSDLVMICIHREEHSKLVQHILKQEEKRKKVGEE
tara:strand:+ start:247 stop:453 length:207 start_codon:yes stop_codon:yes gene_type:complete